MPTLAHSTLNGRLRLPNSILQTHAKSVKSSYGSNADATMQMQKFRTAADCHIANSDIPVQLVNGIIPIPAVSHEDKSITCRRHTVG